MTSARALVGRVAVGAVLCVLGIAVASHLLAGPAAMSLSGVVRDPAGKPVPAVWLAREGFKDRSGGTPWWRSDADGKFRIDGLLPGEVVLRVVTGQARVPSWMRPSAPISQGDGTLVVPNRAPTTRRAP